MPFPDIDPIAVQIGGFAIRWYALAYLAGIIFAWWHMVRMLKIYPVPNLTAEGVENFIIYAIMAILIGGRMGYVAFYNLDYYSQNPVEIFMLWNGGMSFHGGMLAVFIIAILFAKKHDISILKFGDLIALAAPIGILFGRLANFINGELYGRVTDVSWAVVFPNSDGAPRHPSQLYEAVLEGAVIFITLNLLYQLKAVREKSGLMSGLILLMYASFRSFVEQFREPDTHIGFVFSDITMGQILSAPMWMVGAVLIILSLRPRERSS